MNEADQETITLLRAAMSAEVRGHHLDPGRAVPSAVTISARRSPRRVRGFAIAAGLLAAAAVAAGYVALRPGGGSTNPPAGGSCTGVVQNSALPTWARSGFSERVPVQPHVLAADGQIVAILWHEPPLYAPPRPGENNKILWVAREPSAARLSIRATLGGSDLTVTRRITVGPSSVDMPAAGCWTFHLAWHGHRDTLRLPYTEPASSDR